MASNDTVRFRRGNGRMAREERAARSAERAVIAAKKAAEEKAIADLQYVLPLELPLCRPLRRREVLRKKQEELEYLKSGISNGIL